MSILLETAASNAILAGLFGVLLLLAGRLVRRPALLHGLWLVVLLKLLSPPLLRLPVDLQFLQKSAEAATVSSPAGAVRPGAPGPMGSVPTPFASELVVRTVRGRMDFDWRLTLWMLWVLGSLVYAGSVLRKLKKLRKGLLLAKAAPLKLPELVRDIRKLGIQRRVEIRTLPENFPPFLWPWGKTVQIVLPAGVLTRLSSSAQRQLVAHELAHYRRRDHWAGLLQLACMILFWWHPVVWLARRKIHEYQEICCDAWVVRLTARRSPGAYARTLLQTLDLICEKHLPVVAPGMARGTAKFIRRRLEMIMMDKSATQTSARGFGLILFFAVTALPLAASTPPGEQPRVPPSQEETRPEPTPADTAEEVRQALREVDTESIVREAMAEVDRALREALSKLDEARLELEIRQELEELDVAGMVARTLAEVTEALGSAQLEEEIRRGLEARRSSQEEAARILEDVRRSVDLKAIEQDLRETLQGIDVDRIVEEALREAERAGKKVEKSRKKPGV